VLLDPPRPGATAQVRNLARSGVASIIYVSCNPASFARDAGILRDGGYKLDRVVPIDQFVWSPHIELFAQFTR
jgi:23S rRNA (uracil1939-C5)-methyltransferase